MDRKDDTMNLDALKEMLSDVPDSGEFDLDSIIAEVAGGAPAEPKKAPQPAEEPPKAQPAAEEKRHTAPQPEAPAPRPAEQAPAAAPAEPAAEEEAEYDPRAARIAAREAKAAARREKAAAKAEAKAAAREARRAAKEAARAAEQEPEELIDDIPPMPAGMQPIQPVEPAEEAPRTAPKSRRARREEPAVLQPEAPVEIEQELPEEPAEEEIDPRAARIAAREAKAAARREKAAAKAAAKSAAAGAAGAAAAGALADEAEQSAEHMTRKQARAARRAAELAEEEEEIELLDPAQAAQDYKRRARGLSVRSFLVLLLAAAAAYLSIAPSFDVLPLPIVLDVVENPTIGIAVLIALQFVALFLGVDVFGMGFGNLLHGMPDRASLVSFAVLASLLHGASIIVFDNQAGVAVPYLAISILLLYASMREERGRCAALARAYQAFCSAEQPMAVYSHYDQTDDACRAVKAPLYDDKAFLMEMERPDTADRFSMIYVPIALAASIILALVASVGQGEPVRFFWAFSAILSVAAPLGMLCAFGAGYNNVSRRLLGQGAALAGARQANLLRGTEEVVLEENDLFPTGSIALESLENMGRMPDDRLLACAAALTDAAGLELGRVLTEATRERYGVTLSARSVRLVEGGVTGEIGTSHVVLGTAALMVQMGVRIHAGQGDHTCVYLLVDKRAISELTLQYQPTKNTYRAMRLMRRMHMNALLAVRDFNVSPAMVEAEFDLRRGFADQPDPAGVERLLDPAYAQGDAPAAILTREGAGPYMQVLRCADKLAGAVRSLLTLGAFAGICGMLIVFYLVFQNAVDALPVTNLLLYLLIWYIPSFIITLQTH